MQGLRWRGSSAEMGCFAAGLVVQCPRVSEDKKHLKEMLAELLAVFEVTHVLIIDSPDISSFLTRNCPAVHRFNASRLEGVDSLLKLQKKNKLSRYFGAEACELLRLRIEEVTLYELIESENRSAYVRQVDLRTELVNKTAVSVLNCERTHGRS